MHELDRGEVARAAAAGRLSDLPRRLVLLHACRTNSLQQVAYLARWAAGLRRGSFEWTAIRRKVCGLVDCGQHLVFQVNAAEDFARLASGRFCRQDKLCGSCARLRSARLVRAKRDRCVAALEQRPGLKVVHVVWTVKNGPHLRERFAKLDGSLSSLINGRKEHLRGRNRTAVLGPAAGGVVSVEIKRGRDSGLWHPHAHAALLLPAEVDVDEYQRRLCSSWEKVTGGESWNVHAGDIRPRTPGASQDDTLAAAFAEVFKYATKSSSMTPADSYHASVMLGGRRLVRSFGCLLGTSSDDEPAVLGDVDNAVDFPLDELHVDWTTAGYVEQNSREPLRVVPRG